MLFHSNNISDLTFNQSHKAPPGDCDFRDSMSLERSELPEHFANYHTPNNPQFDLFSRVLQVDGAFSLPSSESNQFLDSSISSPPFSPLANAEFSFSSYFSSKTFSAMSSLPDISNSLAVANASWFSQTSPEKINNHKSFKIPVLTGFRPPKLPGRSRSNCNVRIHRDNRFLQASSLPSFTVYNMRSIWSKLNNLAEDIIVRNVHLCFLSEVWEKKENINHQKGIEHLLEMKGINYISTPRPGTRRGGGTAIAANPD